MSTFLLEMALDEARLRQRLGERLLAEREQRGGGNARRFPQPKMAELLGVTLRTYQDWEGGIRVPSWRNLEEIADKLDVPVSELVGDAEVEEPPAEATPPQSELRAMREELRETRAVVRLLRQELQELRQLLLPDKQASGRGR